MSNKEFPSQNKEPFKELPKPKEGLFDNLTFELLTDRANFVKSSLTHMNEENPDLHKEFLNTALTTPNRDIALDWALLYYELNARPARDSNISLYVSQDALTSWVLTMDREISPLRRQMEEVDPNSKQGIRIKEQARRLLVGFQAKDEEMRKQDGKRSSEFSLFWASFLLLKGTSMMVSGHEDLINFLETPLIFIARSLHAQAEANKVIIKFPSA